MSNYKRSRYSLQSKGGDAVKLVNTFTGAKGTFPITALEMLRTGMGSGPVFDALVAQGHLVPASRDELELAQKQQLLGTFRTDDLELIILPTEQCNFRCVYCYEKFPDSYMSAEVMTAIKALVSKRAPGLKRLQIQWFGGEPLLAKDTVLDLSRYFYDLSQSYGFDLVCSATTNGYFLTPDLAPELLSLGLKHFQITLDGPAEFHDKKRVLRYGGGSFEQIWANLIALKELDQDFSVVLRCNFDQENFKVMESWLAQLGEAFGGDSRFTLHLHPVGRWGGANDGELAVMEDAQTILPGAYRHGLECGLEPSELGLKPFSSVCYAARPNSFVVRADGRLNKCTVALDDERNQVGHLLTDGTLELDRERLEPWIMDNALQDTGCQACSLRPACQGSACPLEKMDSGKRPCPPIKHHFKDYLSLICDGLEELSVVQ